MIDISISRLDLLVCILAFIAFVTIHNYIIMSAVHRVEKEIEDVKRTCVNTRDTVYRTDGYVLDNYTKVIDLLRELRDDMEENDGK